MKKPLISAMLASAVLVSVLASCGETTDPASADSTADADTKAAAETEESRLYSDTLTPVDYGKESFRIYTSNHINGWTNATLANYAAEESGEVVNDALFARDRFIEETYNVDLEYTVEPDGNGGAQFSLLTKSITAGDDAFDMILQDQATVCKALSLGGMIYPLTYIDTIDLKADYWMPELNDRCRIGDSLYFASCAISPRYYGSVYLVAFNRDMARDLDLEDMYDLVDSGKWTVDMFFALAKTAVRDANGDGKINTDDQLGMMFDAELAYVMGADYLYVENHNGKLVSNMEDAGMINLMQKLNENFRSQGNYWAGHPDIDYEGVINNGTALFFNPMTADLADYRDLPYDYGILPYPKLDEAQKGYVCYSQPWVNTSPMVPINVVGDRLDMAGTLINAMAAYGYDYIRPAVFDNVICLKGTRDEQSARIVDKIFENITFDLVSDLSFGSFSKMIQSYLGRELDGQDIVSRWAAIKSETEAKIQEVMSTYAAFEDQLG